MFETDFLTPTHGAAYRDAVAKAVDTLLAALPSQPYSGKSASELATLLKSEILPATGAGIEEALHRVRPVIANSIVLTHPSTIAHLHSPPLLASLAADVIVSALNQSMDSFDQAPAATVIELAMSRWLCDEAGLPAGSDAIFTSGATQSNFMGLLLARDACIASRWQWSVQRRGLPAQASRVRFLCSEVAHFTVEKSASQLGLGSDAVIKVPVDDDYRMIPGELAKTLRRFKDDDLIPAAIVGTAGTTDFGSIDPLPEIAALAREAGAWFHIDAAYGSALLLSQRHRDLLRGFDQADSISMDFHKNFWQAISCGAFLLRDSAQFRHLEVHADYLNPETDEDFGIPNLVNKSLATTRRFDALKLWLSFQALGREKFGRMVDRTIELAAHAAAVIRNNPALELLHQPRYGCVVFRYRPARPDRNSDALNAALRQRLFERGVAVIGHTRVRGRQCLKFTCMNPTVSEKEIEDLLRQVVEQGRAIGDLSG
ncbi:MAG: aspartate aminotransferase family protein [Acidobacteriia bacterium]|nr:aspartate aminotransferase family protein [Terriglobia bacterium]